MDEKNLKEICDDFTKFLKEHSHFPAPCDDSDSMDDMMGMAEEEIAEMAAKQANLFCQIRPKAVDILVEKEHEFLGAVKELIEKHKSLETVEQIEKFTKDILKLCK